MVANLESKKKRLISLWEGKQNPIAVIAVLGIVISLWIHFATEFIPAGSEIFIDYGVGDPKCFNEE